jgi:predicted GTPase
VDAAASADVQDAIERLRQINSRATIVRAASPVQLSNPGAVRGRRVLVVGDGPTITHGGMPYGAGYVAAVAAGAAEIIDPRSAAVPMIEDVFRRYPHIGPVLPAVGYGSAQLQALEATINAAEADVVVVATPLDLTHLMRVNKSVVRASYEFAEAGEPTLGSLVDDFLARV